MKYRRGAKRGRKVFRKKRSYKRRLRKARNDGIITRKVHAEIVVTENNVTNVANVVVNWFGISDLSNSQNLSILDDQEHTDACTRFQYWKLTYGKIRFFVNDMIQISNESFTGSWGYGQLHMASDPTASILDSGDPLANLTSRPDYRVTPLLRGKVYKKGINLQKYLKRHNPDFVGWRDSRIQGTNYGSIFHTCLRAETVNLGADVPLGKVVVTGYLKYMNYRVAGI